MTTKYKKIDCNNDIRLMYINEYYTNLFKNSIISSFYNSFKNIYKEAEKTATLSVNSGNKISKIQQFQKQLKDIKNWNQDTILTYTSNIKKDSKLDSNFDDIVKCIIKSNIEVLTKFKSKSNKEFIEYYNKFESKRLVYKCYIECAKIFYNYPYVFLSTTDNDKKSVNLDIFDKIDNAISNAIRLSLPLNLITNNYLENNILETENEEYISSEIPSDPKTNILANYLNNKNNNNQKEQKEQNDIREVNKHPELKNNPKHTIFDTSAKIGNNNLTEILNVKNKEIKIPEQKKIENNKINSSDDEKNKKKNKYSPVNYNINHENHENYKNKSQSSANTSIHSSIHENSSEENDSDSDTDKNIKKKIGKKYIDKDESDIEVSNSHSNIEEYGNS